MTEKNKIKSILNLLESCLAVLIECINDLEQDKRRAQINDAVRRELWQRAEKSQAALFFHLYTRRLSFLSKSTDADREKSSAGDRTLARLQEANVHKHTRAYCSLRTALKKFFYCTIAQVANLCIQIPTEMVCKYALKAMIFTFWCQTVKKVWLI